MLSICRQKLNLTQAFTRARWGVFTIALTYALSVSVGIFMVSTGNSFALDRCAQIVGDAMQNDPAATSQSEGKPFRAALLDFAGNLVIGSVPKTIMGLAVIFPYPFVAYQGWIGGIVSVRSNQSSRFNDYRSAIYYLLTLILQVSGYSLTVGSGVNMGMALYRPQAWYKGEKWWIFPKEAVRDCARLYLLAIPFFLVGSIWEFMTTWNI